MPLTCRKRVSSELPEPASLHRHIRKEEPPSVFLMRNEHRFPEPGELHQVTISGNPYFASAVPVVVSLEFYRSDEARIFGWEFGRVLRFECRR